MITALTMYLILKVVVFAEQPKGGQSLLIDIPGMFILLFGALAIISAFAMDVQVVNILQGLVTSL